MVNPARHSALVFVSSLRVKGFVLALVCLLPAIATQSARAQTYTVLHQFNNTPDGAYPYAGLTMDRAGNFYGTTSFGGTQGLGMVFKLSHKGSGWIVSSLYSFHGDSDGSGPYAPVTIGPDGNLYGTTTIGQGTVFKLAPAPKACVSVSCPWTQTVLYRFNGGADGFLPQTPVTFDRSGNLYGTTVSGGSAGLGVVYQLTPSGSGWTETVLHSFTGSPDGKSPGSGVILDEAGNLYGTTEYGGGAAKQCGTVYRLTRSGSGWTEDILYSFQGQNDGCAPIGGLTFDAAGNLYGTNSAGFNGNGGTVFKLTPSVGAWTYSLLYNFNQPGGPEIPISTLAMDATGNLYGTTWTGDLGGCAMGNGCGNVFKLTFSSGTWSYSSLHDFNESDGGKPYGGVTLDAAGNVYGTTWEGGSTSQQCQSGDYFGCGVIFEITQ